MPTESQQSETENSPRLSKGKRNLRIICGVMIVACAAVLAGSLPGVDFGNLQTEPKLLVFLATVSSGAFLVVAHLLFGIIAENTTAKAGKGSEEERGFAVVRGAWLVRYALLGAVFFLNQALGRVEESILIVAGVARLR